MHKHRLLLFESSEGIWLGNSQAARNAVLGVGAPPWLAPTAATPTCHYQLHDLHWLHLLGSTDLL